MATTFYVNSAWARQGNQNSNNYGGRDSIEYWKHNNSEVYAEMGSPTLTWNVNAFQTVTNALKSGRMEDGDSVCLLDDSIIREGTSGIGNGAPIGVSFTVSTAGGNHTLELEVPYRSQQQGDNEIDVAGNMTLESGINCTSAYNIEITRGGGLALNGATLTVNDTTTSTGWGGQTSVQTHGITNNGTLSVTGEGSSLSVSNYSGSGDLAIGDGANVTITNYSGNGTITLTGDATLNITNYTTTPKFDISIDPDHSNAKPYKQLMSNSSITFDNTTVPGISSKPVCVSSDKHTLYYAPKNYYYVNSSYPKSPENTITILDVRQGRCQPRRRAA